MPCSFLWRCLEGVALPPVAIGFRNSEASLTMWRHALFPRFLYALFDKVLPLIVLPLRSSPLDTTLTPLLPPCLSGTLSLSHSPATLLSFSPSPVLSYFLSRTFLLKKNSHTFLLSPTLSDHLSLSHFVHCWRCGSENKTVAQTRRSLQASRRERTSKAPVGPRTLAD